MVGRPCAHWNGARVCASCRTSCAHSSGCSSSPNMIAPRHAFELSTRSAAGGGTSLHWAAVSSCRCSRRSSGASARPSTTGTAVTRATAGPPAAPDGSARPAPTSHRHPQRSSAARCARHAASSAGVHVSVGAGCSTRRAAAAAPSSTAEGGWRVDRRKRLCRASTRTRSSAACWSTRASTRSPLRARCTVTATNLRSTWPMTDKLRRSHCWYCGAAVALGSWPPGAAARLLSGRAARRLLRTAIASSNCSTVKMGTSWLAPVCCRSAFHSS
mmetsp:Transcript_30819/g.67279  ORF Transcript_30819/g.67279 Transcript_30819/m.67279 type:complete len:272 (+) Transcript_30819:321-1136(+)